MDWPEEVRRLRQRIAVHEAGHGVGAYVLNHGPAYIRLEITRDANGEHRFSGRVRQSPQRRLAFDAAWRDRKYGVLFADAVVMGAAGWLAEFKFLRKQGWDRAPVGNGSDANFLVDVADRLCLDADSFRKHVVKTARALRDRPDVWRATLRLAAALDGYWPDEAARNGAPGEYVGEMPGETVREICERAGLRPHA